MIDLLFGLAPIPQLSGVACREVARQARPRYGFTLPDWLVDLTQDEPRQLARERVEAQFRRAGVIELAPIGDPRRPEGIQYRTAFSAGWVDVLYDQWEAPIVTALEELATGLSNFDLLTRLHAAMIDLDLIAQAARTLADYRDGDPASSPYATVADVTEVGIVTMYARSFTGDAKLGDGWRPESEADRELHHWLMDARHGVHAHADRTAERTLVDVNAVAGVEGPPIYAERRATIPADKLREIAAMCERQHERLWVETAKLKHALGSPATI